MLDPDSPLPLYEQLKEELIRQIRGGDYHNHQTLPSERELMERYGVSRITVRRALSDLVHAGLVNRKIGRGTYLSPEPIIEALTELTGHLEELQYRQMNPVVSLLSQGLVPPPPEAAEALDYPEQVLYIRRVVHVGETPLLLMDVCLPADLGISFDPDTMLDIPVHRLLEQHGLSPYAGEQRMAAKAASAGEASVLEIPEEAPVLEVVRTEWTVTRKRLMWSRALYRSDRYQYLIRLHRGQKRG